MVTISIIIATFNAGKTLRQCLDRVVPQLSEKVDLIIIDGGSKDDTKEIVEAYKDKISYFISERDNGVYDAWNKGIKVSKGQWIMFVGADDILEYDAVQKYLFFLNQNKVKDIDFISGKIKSVTPKGKFIQYTGKLWSYKRCRLNMDVTHVASLTNKRYIERVGYFDTNYKICGDYELLLRGGKDMVASFCNELVATMPIGGISFSTKGLKEQLRIKHKVGKMALPFCCVIYIVQIFLFYTYKLRHL